MDVEIQLGMQIGIHWINAKGGKRTIAASANSRNRIKGRNPHRSSCQFDLQVLNPAHWPLAFDRQLALPPNGGRNGQSFWIATRELVGKNLKLGTRHPSGLAL